jgi:DNA-binding CsgD family transcriptional regulator
MECLFTKSQAAGDEPADKEDDCGEFLCRLDGKLRLRNERLHRKLVAWAELLDAAGWCVALKRPDDGTIWLGRLAKMHLLELGGEPTTWSGLTVVLSHIPESSFYRRGSALLIWSGKSIFPPEPKSEANLTRREKEVMCWLREGKSGHEMSIILGCSPRTVDKHLANIYRKLGVSDRSAAIFGTRTL